MNNLPSLNNPLGIEGLSFIEFCALEPSILSDLFSRLGFRKILKHPEKNISIYSQNQIRFFLNCEGRGLARPFFEKHGNSISAIGLKVKDSRRAFKLALEGGAREAGGSDYQLENGNFFPAIKGVGDSLIYFVESSIPDQIFLEASFEPCYPSGKAPDFGFLEIDHLTNNVTYGTKEQWADFYKRIFGFTEIRSFDIHGKKTSLTSYALRSPCGTFSIPINEAKDEKSQINEYIREYKGPGIQHIALKTVDILNSIRKIKQSGIEVLDIDANYYSEIFEKVPGVTEDKREIEKLKILVDGDKEGYLLQIFTKNVVGPIFFEFIQRKNHHSFGEGNFGALFRSIEKDQERRGVL